MKYSEFLKRKLEHVGLTGLADVPAIHKQLFDFQHNVTDLALRRGRFALFLDTGLGKTICQLEWAKHVPGKVLILAPLAVAEQTRREGEKIDLQVHHSRDGKLKGKVTVTNYERMHLFDLSQFNGVVLDESSILKSFMGKTKQALCEAFERTPFRLCCTATPAPNDYMELGNHSAFLGIMEGSEMLTRWFINDTMHFGRYRLKGHAVRSFWEWVASWAACVEKPSDAGGDDSRFELPPLETRINQVETDYSIQPGEGDLFRIPEMSATSMHREKRHSLDRRVALALELAQGKAHNIVWCETNAEAERIADGLGDECVEVHGSESIDAKEEKLTAFSLGQVRCIVSKPSLAGFGLNWQHCAHQIFASLSYSYEMFYQAIRRSWRFGQKKPVRVDVILSGSELPLWQTISRKMGAHQQMKNAMKYAKLEFGSVHRVKLAYNPNLKTTLPLWLKSLAA